MKQLSSSSSLCEFSVVSLTEALFARKSISLTGGAVFGGLAALTTVIVPANIQPFFPVLPFLKFDPAELFSVMGFLIFGPIAGIIAATSHWIFLTATGTNGPLGPAAKFASVLSTLLGLWLGGKIYQRMGARNPRMSVALGSMLSFAMAARISIMLVVNYFIFTYVGPVIFGINYLGFGQHTLQLTLGIQFTGPWLLTAILLFTGAFNALHAVFSVVIPYTILTPLSLKIPQIASGHPWISRFTTR